MLDSLSDLCHTSASRNWKHVAESLTGKIECPHVHENGLNPTSHLLELLSNAQYITLETLESYWETSKRDIVNMLLTKEGEC